ncbi:MAG TPA: hypothetical protein VGX51_10530 [Solirubrobacteraceae bacterium]|jgi:hypothetical protein|nr:hypothetical protein [Solirubrobacteraceae bacterium]
MRRILGAPVASLALALAVPGVALAAHHGRCHHHATSHFSSHHRHGKHLLRFGSASTPTSPTTPTTPTSGENAGTVESFENGVLTVKLADRSMVKGKVTEDTDLRCVPATPPSGTAGDDDQGDGDHQGSWSSGDPAARASDFQSSDQAGQDQGDDDQGAQETCTTELLKTGATVREAELELSGGGAVWERIVLVH